jgi:hypothetical protein
MRYWWRELFGLFLVALGLYLFYQIYVEFGDGRYVEMVVYLIGGIFLLRFGTGFMKVALAARICADIAARVPEPAPVRRNGTVSPGRTAPLGQT